LEGHPEKQQERKLVRKGAHQLDEALNQLQKVEFQTSMEPPPYTKTPKEASCGAFRGEKKGLQYPAQESERLYAIKVTFRQPPL